MIGDFVPIIYAFPTRQDLKIYPISDLHIGAQEAMLELWHNFKSKLKSEPNSYITIGGDMLNNGVKNSVSNVYEEIMRPREQKKWLMKELEDIRDRILCVVPGNHEYRSAKEVDDNPLYDVCCKLDIEDKFRENSAFMVIRLGNPAQSGRKNPTYTMCVIHGAGGGLYTGTSINRNERFGYYFDGLDVLVVGHSHKPGVTRPEKIVFDAHNKKVSLKPFTVVSSTAWTKYAGYALRKMLAPSSYTLAEILLKGNEKDVKVIF